MPCFSFAAAVLTALSVSLPLSACTPSISADTFFCGPEGLCPPGQSCDYSPSSELEYSCKLPQAASPFQCSAPSTDVEPDNTPSEAFSLGVLSCSSRRELPGFGCIDSASDVDHFAFQKNATCGGGAPKVEIKLQFPIGAAPISAELLDSTGTIAASAEFCSLQAETDAGLESQCISVPDLAEGNYTIRIAMDSEGNASCGGECEFNRYRVTLSARTR